MGLKVLFVSFHCCIRCIKEATALTKAGVQIDFLHNKVANSEYIYNLPRQTFYDASREMFVFQLAKITKEKRFDIIHVHNEPDWLGCDTKKVCPDIPVVFDVHDLDSLRTGATEPGKEEKESFDLCDAFIFPSNSYAHKAMVQNRAIDKPAEVILSMCNEEMIGLQDLPRIGGIVYEGGLTADRAFMDFTKIISELFRLGIAMHVYPAGTTDQLTNAYGGAGAIVMQPLSYSTLLRQLSRYDWSFIGAPAPGNPQWNMAMPNKLFESIAAGIPIIAHHAAEVASFVEEHNIGIVVQDTAQIKDRYHLHEVYRQNVRAKRKHFIMESQTDKILDLYKKIMPKPIPLDYDYGIPRENCNDNQIS